MDELAEQIPYFNTIINPQARGERSRENKFAVRGPFALRRIRCINCRYLGQRTSVVNIDIASKITEAPQEKQSRLGVERYVVRESSTEVMQRPDTLIEKHNPGRHN